MNFKFVKKFDHFWDREKAIQIQKMFRGYTGRLYYFNKQKQEAENQELQYYHYCCSQIQKCYRGYSSRKYKPNYYIRKQFIKESIAKGIELREQLNKYHEETTLVVLF